MRLSLPVLQPGVGASLFYGILKSNPVKNKCMNIAYTVGVPETVSVDRAYIARKVGAVEKLLSRPERAEVEISDTPHGRYRVEIAMIEPGNVYRADAEARTVEAAADLVEEKLREQIRDAHDKRRALQRRGARSIKKGLVIDEDARF